MKELTMTDFREDKGELEKEIRNLISAFETKFGVCVEMAGITHDSQIGKLPKTVSIHLDVEL